MDHCPACGVDTKGARFCRMCGAPLLADALVDTAAGQAAGARSESAPTMPVASLPEQFESLFRPMTAPRPMDATQPMSILPADVAGLPPAPPSPLLDDDVDDPESRRRLFAIVGVGTVLVALVVVIAVLLLGDSGPAASGTPNPPNLATAAASAGTTTAPPAAANAPASDPTTASTPPSRLASSTTPSAPRTTARSTPTKPASAWPGNLSFGARGARVRQVQEALQHLHYYYGRITGDYDGPTTASVAIFQSSRGIRATGTVDQATWDALMKAVG